MAIRRGKRAKSRVPKAPTASRPPIKAGKVGTKPKPGRRALTPVGRGAMKGGKVVKTAAAPTRRKRRRRVKIT